jgi:hypothetical protein
VAGKSTFAPAQKIVIRCRDKAPSPWRSLRLTSFALLFLWALLPLQAPVAKAHDVGQGSPAYPLQSHSEDPARQNLREYSIKAAVIYNFAKFTAWPDQAFPAKETPLRFCILGQDPFGETLKTIVGKSVHGRELQVHRPVDLTDAEDCHLVFVSRSENGRLPEVLRGLGKRPILTISEIDDFAAVGGMIAIKIPEGKIRFEVNLESARTAGLYLSSRLLGLAKVLRTQESHRLPRNPTINDNLLPGEEKESSR